VFGVDGQLRADDFDQVGAREGRFLDVLRGRRQPVPIQRCQRGFFAGLAGLAPRRAIDRQTPLIGAPLPPQLGPGELFGLGRTGRFLRGRELGWRQLAPIRHDQISGRPLA
jgi:hypothetical protein